MRRILLFVLAATLLLGAKTDESCPIPPNPATTAQLYETLSANAEAVSSSRRRATKGTESPDNVLPVANFIDTHIAAKMTANDVSPTVLSGDEEFLRRVMLDLTGQIPDSATVTAFTADTAANKREKKIDELIASDAFVDRWTMWFGDLVQNVRASNNINMQIQGRNAYYTWIKDSIRANKPYDLLVREVLTGKGDSFVAGQANYYVRQIQRNGPPQDTYDNMASHSGEKFLGMPMLCVSCHNGIGHLEQVNVYLSKKQRSDFYKMAAFFSRTTSRATIADPAQPNVRKFDIQDNNPTGRYNLNTTDGNKSPRTPLSDGSTSVTPAFILTGAQPNTNENYRDAYARLLTADRQFARAAVNYLWKEMYGLGIVEPVNSFDLIKLSTQATHPDLLEELTTTFISSNYNLRTLLKTMAMSSTYQLSSAYVGEPWNEAWVPYYARRYPRRMMSEMLLDAVTKATSVPLPITVQGLGPVTRAMQLPDPLEPGARQPTGLFLNGFGRGDRDDVFRTNESSMSQALSMMNDSIVTTRVRRATANSTVAKVTASTTDPGSVADQLYLATLSRKPTAAERQAAIDYLRAGTLATRAEDLQFTLINSLEFLFN
jgi:hypothetical protein